MADKQELKLDESKGGSKKKLIIIIAAAVLVVVIVAVILIFVMGGSSKEDEAALEAQKNAAPLLVPGAPEPDALEIHYIKFEAPFMVQLHTKPRERLAQIHITVTTNNLADKEAADTHVLLIKSIISSTLDNVDPNIFNEQSGREQVKADCLKAVQNALFNETGRPIIDKVLFTGFVMQ